MSPWPDSRPRPPAPCTSGSLLAAVGSYLDARAHGARWLVRIEDLDTPRVIPGCADEMLRTLEAFGFEWDGEVLYQSTRRAAYRDALAAARRRGTHLRLQLHPQGSRRGRHRRGARLSRHLPPRSHATGPAPRNVFASAIRRVDFDGSVTRECRSFDLTTCGDVVVERRDGIASYQLAVVVDDAYQGVTRVVRGADLLASTPWQIDLQAALGAAAAYLRTPAAAAGTGRHQTIQVEAVGTARSLASGQRAYRDPYAFIPDPTPRIGAIFGQRRVEMGTCALEPTSACGQRHAPACPSPATHKQKLRLKLWGAARCTKVATTRRVKA